jgi:hypothetical protein
MKSPPRRSRRAAARYDPAPSGAVAQLAKAPVSKTGDSRFESWLPRLVELALQLTIPLGKPDCAPVGRSLMVGQFRTIRANIGPFFTPFIPPRGVFWAVSMLGRLTPPRPLPNSALYESKRPAANRSRVVDNPKRPNSAEHAPRLVSTPATRRSSSRAAAGAPARGLSHPG